MVIKVSEIESRNYYVLVSLMGWVYKMILNFILIMIYYVENYIYWFCLIIFYLFIVIGLMIDDWFIL